MLLLGGVFEWTRFYTALQCLTAGLGTLLNFLSKASLYSV
jgi:hypothetical protein